MKKRCSVTSSQLKIRQPPLKETTENMQKFWFYNLFSRLLGMPEKGKTDRGGILNRLTSVGVHPDDTDEVRSQKALLSLLALFGFIAGMSLGIHNIVFEYPSRGLPPFSYAVVSLIGFIHFSITRKLQVLRFIQLSFILCMPFLAQITNGGFILSGSSIIWSLGSPICAVLFHGPAGSFRWFVAYVLMILAAAQADGWAASLEAAQRLSFSPWFFVGHLLGISLILFMLVQFFVYRIRLEQEKSENLLLNVLPRAIAERLKHNEGAIADSFNDVTILFADIAGFTEISSRLQPNQLLEMLNRVFSTFDRLAEKHGLEKIKTIGDAYMVVSGLPEPRTDHVEAILHMALEMRDVVEEMHSVTGHALKVRIGINTGPVIAGVIGIRKFIYDLWGDAVNVASRMESTGLVGGIQVTEEVFEKCRDQFVFEKRGLIHVKGKGEMTTYLLVSVVNNAENGSSKPF